MTKGLIAIRDIRSHYYKYHSKRECLEDIEKELKRLEELEKAFKALSKDDEKAKKLLSKEIEKNRALEIILKEFRFTFDDEEQSVMIDNCYTVIFHNKKKYELLKEVLLWTQKK